jgi:hypothetical protein
MGARVHDERARQILSRLISRQSWAKGLVEGAKLLFIIRAQRCPRELQSTPRAKLAKWGLAEGRLIAGGSAGASRIKVGNMVRSCCRRVSRAWPDNCQRIADMFFPQRLSMPSAMVRKHAR